MAFCTLGQLGTVDSPWESHEAESQYLCVTILASM
jgi:hypothetical protein